MAISNHLSKVKMCSFNMHGYNNGIHFVNLLCSLYDIILLQEHWLLEQDLAKLNLVHPNFTSFGISAMNKKADEGILIGRPFGGTAVLWNKSISSSIKIIDNDCENGRYITFRLLHKPKDFVITNVYYPCVKSSADYIIEASRLNAHVDNIVNAYPQAYHVIAGDFNFECVSGNKGYELFKPTVDKNRLLCCDDMVQDRKLLYTYQHESLNQTSWLDHFFVSASCSDMIVDNAIIDSGVNISDHFPISCVLLLSNHIDTNTCTIGHQVKERWDKANLCNYCADTGALLQSIVVPSELLKCQSGCTCALHNVFINLYYEEIVKALYIAGCSNVPSIPCNNMKEYWNSELTSLKNISVDMHVLWKSIGCPRTGVINEARIKAKLKYKQAIKQASKNYEKDNADTIGDYFVDKDTTNFWRSWNARYNPKPLYTGPISDSYDAAEIAGKFKEHYSNIYTDSSANSAAVLEFNKLLVLRQISCSSNGDENITVGTDDVELCISKLKLNKAASHDKLVSEHIVHSHPSIILHLKNLFNLMILHMYRKRLVLEL